MWAVKITVCSWIGMAPPPSVPLLQHEPCDTAVCTNWKIKHVIYILWCRWSALSSCWSHQGSEYSSFSTLVFLVVPVAVRGETSSAFQLDGLALKLNLILCFFANCSIVLQKYASMCCSFHKHSYCQNWELVTSFPISFPLCNRAAFMVCSVLFKVFLSSCSDVHSCFYAAHVGTSWKFECFVNFHIF